MPKLTLRQWRELLGVKQDEVARAAGLHYASYVSSAETNPDKFPNYVRQTRRGLARIWRAQRQLAQLTDVLAAREAAAAVRVANQQALFALVIAAAGELGELLKTLMLNEAIEHLTNGEGDAYDALAAWLPPAELDPMADAWVMSCAPHREHPESMGPTEVTRCPDGSTDDPGR